MSIDDYTSQDGSTVVDTTPTDTETVIDTVENNAQTPNDNEMTENIIEQTKSTTKMYLWIPTTVHTLIVDRATAERRTNTVVIQKALEEFIEESTYEPRPYIPENLLINNTKYDRKVSYTLPVGLYESFIRRGNAEGRTTSTLFIAAVIRYIVKHRDESD